MVADLFFEFHAHGVSHDEYVPEGNVRGPKVVMFMAERRWGCCLRWWSVVSVVMAAVGLVGLRRGGRGRKGRPKIPTIFSVKFEFVLGMILFFFFFFVNLHCHRLNHCKLHLAMI